MTTPRGNGALTIEQQEEALALIDGGLSQKKVASRFGVSKNVVASLWHRFGDPQPRASEATTLFDRCDALHAKMDAVLAATVGVGRIASADEPKKRQGPLSFGKLF